VIALLVGAVVLLWFVLAVAVNVHAKRRNRSGAFWFFVVLFTGIFGMMGYLLVITSGESMSSEDMMSIEEIISDVSDFAIMGAIAVFLFFFMAFAGFGIGVSLLTPPILVVIGRLAHEKWDLKNVAQELLN
jgi:TctA family transporter